LNHKFFYSLKRSNKFTAEEIKKLKSLKLYNENSKFYQLVFTYLSYNFSDNNLLNHLNNIYYKIDKNCDWKITKGELFQAYKDAGIPITLEEIDKIISLMDFDQNGNIDYEEFIRMCIPRDQLFTDKNLENAFLLFDKDKKGFITPKDIINVIKANKILDDDLKKAIKEEILEVADEIIDCNEFKHLMLYLTGREKLKST
jgi:calcium-dependent protein kinase